MALTYVAYTGTGSQTDFVFSFQYLDTTDVYVTVNGSNVPFTFVTSSIVRTTTPPQSGSAIQIRRRTQQLTPAVNFTDGSVLLEADLDRLANYAFYVAQEQTDSTSEAVAVLGASNLATLVSNVTTAAQSVTSLGIVNINTETAISATTTLPNLFPASYLLVDSGTPVDYNVIMPSAAVAGSLVFIRVSPAATKLYSLYDNGTLFEGIDRRILWAGESAMLLKTATGWIKIGGRSIPFHGQIRRLSNQSLITGWNTVQYTSAIGDSKGLNLCYDTVGKCFTTPRNGLYAFTSSLSISGVPVGSESYSAFCVGNSGGPAGVPIALSIGVGTTGLSRMTHNLSNSIQLGRSSKFGVTVNPAAGASPVIEYALSTLETTLAYQEVLTW